MTKELFFQAILKFALGIILIAALIFIPAGTIHYLNGWIFMGILFIPMFFAGIIMMCKNPDLLKKRLILFLSMPLVLGAPASFVIFLAYPIIIAKRINNEEKVLEEKLQDYAEYKTRVKYKIIPFVW